MKQKHTARLYGTRTSARVEGAGTRPWGFPTMRDARPARKCAEFLVWNPHVQRACPRPRGVLLDTLLDVSQPHCPMTRDQIAPNADRAPDAATTRADRVLDLGDMAHRAESTPGMNS